MLQSGLMGISTFLPNKEQGVSCEEVGHSSGPSDLLKPSFHLFTACLGNTPALLVQGKRLRTSREYQKLGRCSESRLKINDINATMNS